MSPSRYKALQEAIALSNHSLKGVNQAAKVWSVVHDRYNDTMTQQPRVGRHSGHHLQALHNAALSAYEALLDALRVHSDNLAHLAALKGQG